MCACARNDEVKWRGTVRFKKAFPLSQRCNETNRTINKHEQYFNATNNQCFLTSIRSDHAGEVMEGTDALQAGIGFEVLKFKICDGHD